MSVRAFAQGRLEICAACSEPLQPIEREHRASSESILQLFVSALRSPLDSTGQATIGAAGVFLGILLWVSAYSIFGWLGLFIAAGLFLAYAQRAVYHAGTGGVGAPDWPDVSALHELVPPILYLLASFGLGFAPVLVIATKGGPMWLVLFAVLFGFIYAPMAWLAGAMLRHFAAVTPLVVIPALLKVTGYYWVVCVILAVGAGVSQGVSGVLAGVGFGPIGPILSSAWSMYVVLVVSRMLGDVYIRSADRLGWE